MSGEMPSGVVSVLTPTGRGAIAVVAASGPAALDAADKSFAAANGRQLREQPADRIVFGHWSSGDHREEVVLVRGAGGAIEVHCHGGAAAVGRITDAMLAAGCHEVPWADWLKQFRRESIAPDAEIALAQATTRRTAAILLDQRNGALAGVVSDIRSALERGEAADAQRRLTALADRASLGLHLTQPWQVAIAGRPNVGKSSLINALVGYQRAIVFDQPGTTRDVLAANTAIDGWPVRLTDAAGIRTTSDPLEAEGVARARQQLGRADLVLWVLDATCIASGHEASARAAEELREEMGEVAGRAQLLVVLNKIDLLLGEPIAPGDNVVAVSALNGSGLDKLLAAIAQRLVPAPAAPGEAIPFSELQIDRLRAALAEVTRGDFAAADMHLAALESASTASAPSSETAFRE